MNLSVVVLSMTLVVLVGVIWASVYDPKLTSPALTSESLFCADHRYSCVVLFSREMPPCSPPAAPDNDSPQLLMEEKTVIGNLCQCTSMPCTSQTPGTEWFVSLSLIVLFLVLSLRWLKCQESVKFWQRYINVNWLSLTSLQYRKFRLEGAMEEFAIHVETGRGVRVPSYRCKFCQLLRWKDRSDSGRNGALCTSRYFHQVRAFLSEFFAMFCEGGLGFIGRAPRKQCSLDPVPAWIVKECSELLSPVLATMINVSFSEGIFPSRLGSAIISPILKKPNLNPFELKSWRPISNLSFVSKLFERIAVSRLGTHISSNQLLPACQSAYRKGHSTETAIAAVMNDIIRTVDRGEFCALVLLDLSAAFDTIDHGILFDVLEKIRNEPWRPEMDDVLFRGTDTNVPSWQRGFWSTYTEVWSSSRIGCWTSNFRLLHGGPTGSSDVLRDQLPPVCRRHPAYRQDNPPGLGCLSPQDRELCRISSRMVLKPPTSTEFWQDRIDMVRHALDAPQTPGPWDRYPCRWRGGQTGRISARPWCHVGLPAEYAGSYQQDCIGLLLSSPQDSTTSTLPRQGRSTKTRIGSRVVEDRLLQRRTCWITCDFTGSSPASHQRRCSLSRHPPTSRPCQPCSTQSTLAPNPWANIIQGVPHDVQRRQWNSADIHDWHGHAHLRSSRSVSSPFCRRETVWRASHSNCVWFQGFLNRWPSGLEWSPCPC